MFLSVNRYLFIYSCSLFLLFLCSSALANTPDLIIPHPRMFERQFVLKPLMEIADTNIESLKTVYKNAHN